MFPKLRFETVTMKMSSLGTSASTPDIIGNVILQNNLSFHLDEDDELFESYGKRTNSYPYRQYNAYNRKLQDRPMHIAILENDFLKAVFLPELGGRLWQLYDKKAEADLLYTNDVIRFSNLAIRNAWFSGGVEWNLGLIGHSPFTTEPLHTACLTMEDGCPVLRMYEYERIRGVEYQMDFWLTDKDAYLNCRMRIVNSGKETVPMYWWSNMAVPEYEDGRIAVPANSAYTFSHGGVYKTDIPYVDGIDISRYQTIKNQVDYFFDIPNDLPKFIANLDSSGYGLMHMSTNRLNGRKLFSWGSNSGSNRWQSFLTENAGKYAEIQAGLAKTQYGCIPMPPNRAWEWLEQYGPIQISSHECAFSYGQLSKRLTACVKSELKTRHTEELLRQTKQMALTKGDVIYPGSTYGAFANRVRLASGEKLLSKHLDYGSYDPSHSIWIDFLKTGLLPEKDPAEPPKEFFCERTLYEKLKDTIETQNHMNWYAHYHLALMHLYYDNKQDAKKEMLLSLQLKENPWSRHGLASIYALDCRWSECIAAIVCGLLVRKEDLSYVKEGFRLLLAAGGFQDLEDIYGMLKTEMKQESRLYFDHITALCHLEKYEQAYDLLMSDDHFQLEDLRECEDSLGAVYSLLSEKVNGIRPQQIPPYWNFDSIL